MSAGSTPTKRTRVTTSSLQTMKRRGEKFAMLTAYDASFAAAVDEAGADVILVGDTLGMVIQGHETTLPVTMEDMIYHCGCVARGCQRALVMADMPFMSVANPDLALHNAGRLLKEAGAQAVKLEGGTAQAETVYKLSEHGIPVCSHLGLQPQSVHKIGGYKMQGRDEAAAEQMLNDARALQDAGADLLLLECVPAALAKRITESVDIPVIGIGAGPDTDAQVLVLQDVLGITPGRPPRFAKNFMVGAAGIREALQAYVSAVKEGRFPDAEHTL